MNLKEDLETISPQEEVQQAYDRSVGAELGGEKMQPWTIARQSAAMSLGVSAVKAIGPDVVDLLKSGNYPNILRDVIICMWLCSIPEDDVSNVNCSPGESHIRHAFEWAESRKLVYGSPLFLEGVALIDTIVRDVMASFYSVDSAPGNPKKKVIMSRRGKSKSHTTQSKPADIMSTT